MSEIILMIIILATMAYVAKPYWRRTSVVVLEAGNGHLAELKTQRDNLLTAIKELEFDHQTGKISEQDFAEINAQYRSQAISMMKRIDALGANGGRSQKLEEELRRLRSHRKQTGVSFCAHCGQSVRAGDRFCCQCGKRL
ncbi:zinc ribbon domain-containing protein [candidate division KSB1 bacterium]|nr:zinc ribbon domain-containing protein [candidate division KSB1 bacterium]NIR71179.1 zinc ribbon domain-containing protein [candidate division KSB1 bacterium]NIS26160.1 zinc ribbon domain-containing protein [candidate division KSB1 bacterium]NIT72925.1 zinc ribbon domain-containing protein [candidate division KSB1 bacterium]NIU26799.1 zinc ribbon domain-containing protein [candidate division KSB1 bacterium]